MNSFRGPGKLAFKPVLAGRSQLVLLCFLCGMAFLNAFTLWNTWPLIIGGYPDFAHFYSTGVMTRTGHVAELFDPQGQFVVQQQYSGLVRSRGAPVPYLHPPFEALLFAAFSFLPYFPAYLLWNALNFLILALVPFLLRSDLPGFEGIPILSWPIFLFAFFPVAAVILQGQDDLLCLLLLTLAFLSIRRKANFMAGGWLGLAVFRPQFVLPLMCILVYGGEWRILGGFAVVGLVLGLVTVAVFGLPLLTGYPRHVWSSEQVSNAGGVLVGHMPNLHGLLAGLLSGHLRGSAVTAAVVILSAIVIWYAAKQWRHYRSSSPALASSLNVLAAILVSYHAFAQDLSLLILPALLQVNWILTRKTCQPTTAWFILGPLGFLFLDPICYLMVRYRHFNLFALALLVWLLGSAAAMKADASHTSA